MSIKLMNIIRIAGQLISVSIFALAGGLLVHFRIPGNRTFTDNDAGPLTLVYGIFLIIGIGLLLNSLIFKQKNHWKKYRAGIIVFVIGFGLLVFMPRDVIKWTFFGGKKMEFTSIKNPDFIWVKLELYKNNDFLCSTSHGGEMTEETLGKYKLKDNVLELHLKNGISEHTKKGYQTLYENIGTKYRMLNDTLICIDCEKEIKLKKN
ncbi:hypothetical protein [Psychroserpens sp. SPM9]|uniref:hypothetical protein n=1 Tax=Psychroserpens sp. SPM9 TaxID=2975598 RepID=UPI0021A375ED|nr:hypothetical protein [Psychroserpens sp. SPM9]MDG5493221.1 hypothetical protein [Psychroserpens sp. SPM9]